jgi:hypothetical protein
MKKIVSLIVAGGMFLTACKKKESDSVAPSAAGNYVVYTAQSAAPYTGYLTSFGSAIPTGLISNVKSSSQQNLEAWGFRARGKYVYRMRNAAGEKGVQKQSVQNDGSFKDEGFISCGDSYNGNAQYLIVNDNEGYYFDGDLGLLKIQKFNPTTMQRTGELDFTNQLKNESIGFVTLGQNIMMNKNGKLFANIHYGTSTSKGYLDAVDDTIRFAVIDIATGNLDKVVKYNAGSPQQVGWFGDNAMWEADDDGTLYFCAMGKVAGGNSQILRINANETEIDNTWKISMDNIVKDGFFHNVHVKAGKIYTRIPKEGIKPDFSNIGNEIWEYNIIDIASKTVTKITGVPTVFFNGNAEAIVEIDDIIYLMVTNTSMGINGFYKVDGTSATQLFNVNEGGKVVGFAQLQ